jgi:ADP-ribosylglycohydrolase
MNTGSIILDEHSRSRFRGCLLGLAVGDALGTTLEFTTPGGFVPISDMVGGGPFNLPAGFWTDDTSMALCLAESLVERGGFDAYDQMERYWRWYREGYWSSTGRTFDIGNTVLAALMKFRQTGDPYAGSTDPDTAGNGSLMRLAPVILAYAALPKAAILYAAESSRTTHGAQTAVDACRYFAGLLLGVLGGLDKDHLLSSVFEPVPEIWKNDPLHSEIEAVASGSFRRRNPPEIRGSGYVVHALEAALWAFYHADNFRHGCLLAVNLGEDADTTAAIYGQIAGAYYGIEGIPQDWLAKLTRRQEITGLADKLYLLAQTQANMGPMEP